ncbi:MAG: hypothetical protein AAGD33_18650 [Actinomycetota bacterium]
MSGEAQRSTSAPPWLSLVPAAAILLAVGFASIIFVLGGRDLAQVNDSQVVERGILDDGLLSVENLQDASWSGFDQTDEGDVEELNTSDDDGSRKRCELAEEIYAEIVDGELQRTTPEIIVVPDEDPPTDDGDRCFVVEERRSAQAGLGVLLASTLGGVAALIALPGWLLIMRRRWSRQDVILGGAVTLMVVGVTLIVAGAYRFETHLLVMLLVVALALTPALTSLASATRYEPSAAQTNQDRDLFDRLSERRGEVRTSLIALSVLLSLSVALIATLNGRYAAAFGSLQLNLWGSELGGFDSDDVATVTAVESLLFGAILAAVALPALVNVDAATARVFRARWSRSTGSAGPNTSDDDRAQPADTALADLVEREKAAATLGIATRPVQWVENALAVAFPVITGLAADFLGLLS